MNQQQSLLSSATFWGEWSTSPFYVVDISSLIVMTTLFPEHPYSTRCGLWTWFCFLLRAARWQGLWHRSALRLLIPGWPQQVHLEASVAVQEVVLEHLKVWISPQESSYTPSGTAAMGKAMLERFFSEELWPWISLCHSRYDPEDTVPYR